MTHPCPSLCSTTMICGRSLGTRSFTSRLCSLGSELDNADEVEDHDDDNDHAHDPNAAASSVHVDLLLSRTTRHARGGSWSYDSAATYGRAFSWVTTTSSTSFFLVSIAPIVAPVAAPIAPPATAPTGPPTTAPTAAPPRASATAPPTSSSPCCGDRYVRLLRGPGGDLFCDSVALDDLLLGHGCLSRASRESGHRMIALVPDPRANVKARPCRVMTGRHERGWGQTLPGGGPTVVSLSSALRHNAPVVSWRFGSRRTVPATMGSIAVAATGAQIVRGAEDRQ